MKDSLKRLEEQLAAAAKDMSYPATPDLRARMRPTHANNRRLRLRFAGMALIVLLITGSMIAVPPVRAAVLALLRIGAVEIVPAPATPPVISTPPAEPMLLRGLAGRTTLDTAAQLAKHALKLPRYPKDLGQPDRVYIQDLGGPVIILAWLDPAQPEQARLILQQLPEGTYAQKLQPEALEQTTVNGHAAVWTKGPYLMQFIGPDGEPFVNSRQLVVEHALIWTEGTVTYRLETLLPIEEAVRIAESLDETQE